jgi:hypothetical protein
MHRIDQRNVSGWGVHRKRERRFVMKFIPYGLGTVLLPCLMIGLLALVWVLPLPSLAQDKSSDMQIVREKILADRKLFVAGNMELTEAEGKAFWPVHGAYIQDLQKLGAKGAYIIDDFARNYQDMTDAKVRDLLDEYMAYEAEYLALRQDYLPRFRNVIPEKKVTRCYQIENKIRAVVNFELAGQIPLMQ